MKPFYSGGDIVFPQVSTVLGNVSYPEENMDTLSINNRNTLTINLKSITLTSKRSSLTRRKRPCIRCTRMVRSGVYCSDS